MTSEEPNLPVTLGLTVRLQRRPVELPDARRLGLGVVVAHVPAESLSGILVDHNDNPVRKFVGSTKSATQDIDTFAFRRLRLFDGSIVNFQSPATLYVASKRDAEAWERAQSQSTDSYRQFETRVGQLGGAVYQQSTEADSRVVTAFIPAGVEAKDRMNNLLDSLHLFGLELAEPTDRWPGALGQLSPEDIDMASPGVVSVLYAWMTADRSHEKVARHYLGVSMSDMRAGTDFKRSQITAGVLAVLDHELRENEPYRWIDNLNDIIQSLDTYEDVYLGDESTDPLLAKEQEFQRRVMSGDTGHKDLGPVEQLALVGPNKPIGYVNLPQFRFLGADTMSRVATFARRRGNEVTIVRGSEGTDLSGGTMVVYSPTALQHLLDENAAAVSAASWPTTPHEFARRTQIGAVTNDSPEIYRVIAEAFADPRPEYRTSTYDALLVERDAFRDLGGLDAVVPSQRPELRQDLSDGPRLDESGFGFAPR